MKPNLDIKKGAKNTSFSAFKILVLSYPANEGR